MMRNLKITCFKRRSTLINWKSSPTPKIMETIFYLYFYSLN